MAKNQAAPAPKKLETREGLSRNSGDVVGFKDPEKQGPLYGIPRAMKASDSQLDASKPSIFVIFELLESTTVTEGSSEDAKEITAKKGDMVGLWVKGGMRPLRNFAGLNVLVQYGGEKKLKNRPAGQDPMKIYHFDTNKPVGLPIPLIEDNRKESRDVVSTWLPAAKTLKPRVQERKPGADEEEDPGF
jgi:hypothetical protein